MPDLVSKGSAFILKRTYLYFLMVIEVLQNLSGDMAIS